MDEDRDVPADALPPEDRPPNSNNTPLQSPKRTRDEVGERDAQEHEENDEHGNKRKNKYRQRTFQHGSRKHTGDKGKNLGRGEYFRSNPDRRQRTAENQAKRQKLIENGTLLSLHLPPTFTKEEIEAEDKKPKRKVAVLIGYAGTGYKGMQIDPKQKTIEGDLFAAFVAAGAISKANADDPKKSSLVRCARTDKGVHAAGNVISLKLIIEDPDIVRKINSHLSPQIRVWGILRTIGSFSCYQACDSRWYEYLIPTSSFLPPHPSSYVGKKLVELAEEVGDVEGYTERQEEVLDFWEETENHYIKPILDSLDEQTRQLVEQALYQVSTTKAQFEDPDEDEAGVDENEDGNNSKENSDAADRNGQPPANASEDSTDADLQLRDQASDENEPDENGPDENAPDETSSRLDTPVDKAHLDATIKTLRQAYITAKRRYRISPERLSRVNAVFARYVGTKNFHNYTVRKRPTDPSAKRNIKSFTVSDAPIEIGGTEWLSLKVHGQSFMMHQIRKMVGLATLIVRAGCPLERIDETLGEDVVAIPKAPGLGLLLERPVFDSYNERAETKFARGPIDFGKFNTEIEEFKRKEIYHRIYAEEERDHVFHSFFSHIDNYKEPTFLYISSKGLAACGQSRPLTNAPREWSRRERKTWMTQGIKKDEETAAGAEGPLKDDHCETGPTSSVTSAAQA